MSAITRDLSRLAVDDGDFKDSLIDTAHAAA
jgi:hypothetical protein